MKNIMKIDGYDAVINYDPEIEMFRGEFINLNGGADFYASDIQGLHKEGQASLNMFLLCVAKTELSQRRTIRANSMFE